MTLAARAAKWLNAICAVRRCDLCLVWYETRTGTAAQHNAIMFVVCPDCAAAFWVPFAVSVPDTAWPILAPLGVCAFLIAVMAHDTARGRAQWR